MKSSNIEVIAIPGGETPEHYEVFYNSFTHPTDISKCEDGMIKKGTTGGFYFKKSHLDLIEKGDTWIALVYLKRAGASTRRITAIAPALGYDTMTFEVDHNVSKRFKVTLDLSRLQLVDIEIDPQIPLNFGPQTIDLDFTRFDL